MLLSLAIILSFVIGVPVIVTFGRYFWAMRSGETFKEFNERQSRRWMRRARKSEERRRKRRGKWSWTALLFGVVFLGFSLFGTYYALSGFYDLWRARAWQAAECTVLSADAEQHRSAKGPTTYTPKISYAYRFDEREFKGDRFDFVGNHYDGGEINEIKKNYPAGAKFPCFVDPQNPTESVISRDARQYPIFKYTIGLFFNFLLAVFLIYIALPERQAKN